LIVELAQQRRLPVIYPARAAVEIGGLMAYAIDFPDLFLDDVDRIFKGTKPGEIPFYQSRNFALVINLKTAKTLGIEMPSSLLARADEAIE
jgi:putative ABC transport system substrate-binding protein